MSNSDRVTVRFARLAHAADLEPPAYHSAGEAGLDLVCALDASESVILRPGERMLAPTGFSLELPNGYEGQVRPRSGLAAKHGVTVLNAPGTIDSDYRGEVKVILVNLGEKAFVVQRGERIAQMVIATVTRATLKEVSTARGTARGAGGFGSTGVAVVRQAGGAKGKRPAKRAAAKKKKLVAFPRRQAPNRSLRRR